MCVIEGAWAASRKVKSRFTLNFGFFLGRLHLHNFKVQFVNECKMTERFA